MNVYTTVWVGVKLGLVWSIFGRGGGLRCISFSKIFVTIILKCLCSNFLQTLLGGAFHKKNLLPTYKIFDTIFKVQRSTLHPLFELYFSGESIGFGKGLAKPVVNLTSLKGWDQKFIFIRVGELAFTPIFSKSAIVKSLEFPALEGVALEKVQNFLGGLGDGFQLTCDSFM